MADDPARPKSTNRTSMDQLETRRPRRSIALDVVMLALISANILLLLFEWIYLMDGVQRLLAAYVPSFYQFYDENIHEHFFWIDLAFISIFVLDLLVEWGIAIARKRYHRWFFYPFVHWYDVLGCIPVGSFRFLRLLRVFSLTMKMQRLDIIDLTTTYPYKKVDKYIEIITEEMSDRVAVNILDGIEEEVRQGTPVAAKIRREVIEPRREAIVATLSERIQRATSETYTLYQEDIRQYVDQLIAQAIEKNREIRTIEHIPMLGKTVSTLLERAVSDIVFTVVDEAVEDLASAENNAVVNHVTRISTDALLDLEDERMNAALREVVLQSLDLIKEQVMVQQWKRREQDRREPEQEVREAVAPPEVERVGRGVNWDGGGAGGKPTGSPHADR